MFSGILGGFRSSEKPFWEKLLSVEGELRFRLSEGLMLFAQGVPCRVLDVRVHLREGARWAGL